MPIIVDKDGVIVAGHTRLKAAQKLGLSEVPVIVADDLTPKQVKAFRLADNKVGELADWDFEKLEEELKNIEMDMSAFNFDMKELSREFDKNKEVIEDNFDVEAELEKNKEPKVKRGQIWKLGNHYLMCGDATSKTDVEKLMGGEKADMVFTDPPYGMGLNTDYSSMRNKLEFAKGKSIKNGKKYAQGIVDAFEPELITTVFKNFGYCKEIFLWGADYFAEMLEDKNNGSWIVWDKRASAENDLEKDESADKMYGSCFELCWSKNNHKRDIARVKWAGVFGIEKEFDHKRYHPTQKPIKLVDWFLSRYTKSEQLIVDLFGGSGSTLLTCEQLNRRCYTMELDPKYCDVIIKRWETMTGKKAKLNK